MLKFVCMSERRNVRDNSGFEPSGGKSGKRSIASAMERLIFGLSWILFFLRSYNEVDMGSVLDSPFENKKTRVRYTAAWSKIPAFQDQIAVTYHTLQRLDSLRASR